MSRDLQSLTSLPVSPNEERQSRLGQYMLAMFLRLVCLYACFVVPGWWILIPVAGVVVLPLVAVALANVVNSSKSKSLSARESNVPSLTSFTP
ncbi:MAG: DUF3099 domain-containing protein [Microbacteriaceae bacterium]|nr:DUF3099 domain-containing protein [Microbacteriaceae bacterium]